MSGNERYAREEMPEWYRVLSQVRDENAAEMSDGDAHRAIGEVQGALTAALEYVDRLRADRDGYKRAADKSIIAAGNRVLAGEAAGCPDEHWIPVTLAWRSVQAGDVILAPPTSDAPAGTPHMILRSALANDWQWVQAVGGGETEPRNAKRDASATITVLYPYEMAVAVGLLDEAGVTA